MTENEVLHTVLNHTEALVYVIDINNYEVLYANAKCINEFGDVLGKTCYQVLQTNQGVPCSFCPLNHVESQNLLHEGMSYQWEHFNTENHRYYIYHDHIVSWGEHKQLAKIQVGIDITSQRLLEQKLQQEQLKNLDTLKSIINATMEGIFMFDQKGYCLFANNTAQNLFGYSDRTLSTLYICELFQDKTFDCFTFLHGVLQEVRMHRKDASTFPALIRQQTISINNASIQVLAILDITLLKQKEEKIVYMAYHDTLTTLPNRIYLKNEMNKAFQSISRIPSFFALLFLDLDHFKTINDTKGHDIGDKVLIETASRLKHALRPNDVLARIGGDEFAILIDTKELTKDKAVRNVFALSSHLLAVTRSPIYIADSHFILTVSIGVALFNNRHHSFDEIMKYADSAMYQAKENGRNKVTFFEPHVQKILEYKAEVLNRLRKAACTGELILFYQPQILGHSRQKKMVGVEVLVRWEDPLRGTILPSEFIGLAEENGCIVQIGEWILKEAFLKVKEWGEDPIKRSWKVSINISTKQLERDDFVQSIEKLLNTIQCNPKKICFELTENILIKNTKSNIHKMKTLKKLGISLSIDDVGVGSSSLAYLKTLPINELKIDRAFVQGVVSNSVDTIIVQMILDIAKHFKIDVVAEGVETIEQYKKLKAMGCNLFQGFFFSKPISIQQLSSLSLPNIEESIK